MKTLVLVTLIAGLTTVTLAAGQAAPTDRAAVEKQLAATEQKINDSFAKKDVAGMIIEFIERTAVKPSKPTDK